MIDQMWMLQQLTDMAKAIIGMIIGFWIYSRFIAPKQASGIAVKTATHILENPKIKPYIDKLQSLETAGLLEKANGIMAKVDQLDWEGIGEAVKSLRIAVEVYTGNNKRVIPPPPESN